MSEHRPDGITVEDWAATPRSVRVLVGALQEQVRLVQAQVTGLDQRVRAVEEQGRQTSRTSSRPPSSDPPSAPPRPARRPSGRTTGANRGMRGTGGCSGRWRRLIGSWTRARRRAGSAGRR